MNQQLKQQIIDYAEKTAPNEMCGFLLCKENDLVFFPCENAAENPQEFFEISPEQQIQAESLGVIEAVIHSHPNGEPTLSLADRRLFSQTACDWLLVTGGQLKVFAKISPLIGREFEYGFIDCYTLFKDFYFLAGWDMAEFERQDGWWERGENLYLDNLDNQGFRRLNQNEDLQIGDIILIQVGADVPNHAAIYIGEQMILQHCMDRLSKRDPYDGYWLKHTHSVWRHKYADKLDFTIPLNTL